MPKSKKIVYVPIEKKVTLYDMLVFLSIELDLLKKVKGTQAIYCLNKLFEQLKKQTETFDL